MKFRSMLFAVTAGIAAMASIPVFAEDAPQPAPTATGQVKQAVTQAATKVVKDQVTKSVSSVEDGKLDGRLSDAMKITQERLNNMSKDEKEKLLDDLNHPDGKTIGQGMASFGKELGQGLGSAVKEAGTTFNDFANSGVGRIATIIIVWKLFGHQILWFIFIILLLSGLGRGLRYVFGQYHETTGKFIKYDLSVFSKLDDGVVFGIFVVIIGVLAAIVIGAAVNL